jgi:hypothetical protein
MIVDCSEDCRKCVILVLIKDINIKKVCVKCKKMPADSKKNEEKITCIIYSIITVTTRKKGSDSQCDPGVLV